MNAGHLDFFELWRLAVATVCAIYAVVVTVRSMWGWYVYLSGGERVHAMMRSYAVVQLLRLRLRRFSWEFAQIGVLSAILLLLLFAHRL